MVCSDVTNKAMIVGSNDLEKLKQQAVLEYLLRQAGVSLEFYNNYVIDKYLGSRIEQIKAEAVEEYKSVHGDEDILAKSRKTRQDKSERLSAYILSQLISGIAPSKIDKVFEGKEFSIRTISRLSKVHNNDDKERIIGVYRNNVEQFGGITEEQVSVWLDKKYKEYVDYVRRMTRDIQKVSNLSDEDELNLMNQ